MLPFRPCAIVDMIQSAGGTCLLGTSGEPSQRVTWGSIVNLEPRYVVNAYCGYDLEKNQEECDKIRGSSKWRTFTKVAEIVATNSSMLFSRPGPGLIQGVEVLAFLMHRIEEYRPKRGLASILKDGEWVDLSEL